MPRQLGAEETFDDLRSEADYTDARLRDEERAAPLVGRTAEWKPAIDDAENSARAVATEEAGIDAARQGGNLALDTVVVVFADDLLPAVRKDREAPGWRKYFRDISVSTFNRQPLADQVKAVRGWLTDNNDPVLEPHRPAILKAIARCDAASARETALAVRRGTLWEQRAALAKRLTNERDALHDDLSAIARDQGLPRNWPDSFFRINSRKASTASTERPAERTPASTPQ